MQDKIQVIMNIKNKEGTVVRTGLLITDNYNSTVVRSTVASAIKKIMASKKDGEVIITKNDNVIQCINITYPTL